MTNTHQADCVRIAHTHDFQPGTYSNWRGTRFGAALSYLPPGPLCRISAGDTYSQCKRLFSYRFCLRIPAKPDDRRFPAVIPGNRHIGRFYDIFSIFSGNIASHTKRLGGQRVFLISLFQSFCACLPAMQDSPRPRVYNPVHSSLHFTCHVVINYG